MAESTRYTVRLPAALDAAVQDRVRAGTPFAVLVQEALSAYLAATPPPPADTLMDLQSHLVALTVRVELLEQSAPTGADSADTSSALQDELATLRARVEILELALTAVPTPRRQDADRPADRMPTGAAPPPQRPRRGRQAGPLRQQILDLLGAHPAGLRAEELRVHLGIERPLADLLQGMQRAGLIHGEGRGTARRWLVQTARQDLR